jgi:hypothetical protein
MRLAGVLGAAWLLVVLSARSGDAAVDSQLVVGIDWDRNDPRAYPLETLNFHEIVNDVDSFNRSFAVTWAPLTGSNVIFRTEDLYSYVIFCIFRYPFVCEIRRRRENKYS